MERDTKMLHWPVNKLKKKKGKNPLSTFEKSTKFLCLYLMSPISIFLVLSPFFLIGLISYKQKLLCPFSKVKSLFLFIFILKFFTGQCSFLLSLSIADLPSCLPPTKSKSNLSISSSMVIKTFNPGTEESFFD